MYRFFAILCVLMILTGVETLAQEESPVPADEASAETPAEAPPEAAEEATIPQEENVPPEEAPPEEAPEEYFEEEESAATETEAAEETPEKAAEETADGIHRSLTIDAVVVVNYTLNNESYIIKYHINMGGDLNADVGMIKGNAKIATDISGYLARTNLFECLLKVSIADVPYEIYFQKMGEKEASVNVAFKGQILEDWESLCTFLDASGAKFNTRGSPERWIGVALEKANPPLTKLEIPVEASKATTLKFSIAKHTIQDEGVGIAEVDGTGVVTLKPAARRAPKPPRPRVK